MPIIGNTEHEEKICEPGQWKTSRSPACHTLDALLAPERPFGCWGAYFALVQKELFWAGLWPVMQEVR